LPNSAQQRVAAERQPERAVEAAEAEAPAGAAAEGQAQDRESGVQTLQPVWTSTSGEASK
jgi:hypothetical protein